MAAAASAFDSLTGRRGVDIGTSFTRAWNERTGKTTKRSKDYPNPEYYSLRCTLYILSVWEHSQSLECN